MIVMRAKPDASKHNFMYVTGVDSGGRGGLGSFARHPLFGEAEKKIEKMKTIVNIMAEIKANTLDRYLVVIIRIFY